MRFAGINETVGKKIRSYRERNDLSQAALAKEVNLSRPSIANIEAGNQALNIEQLFLFADALNTSPASFLPIDEFQDEIYDMTPQQKLFFDEIMMEFTEDTKKDQNYG